MGRPALDSTERRSKITVMRTTEPELEHIRAQADAAGLSVSEFVRRRSLGYVVPTAAGDARRTDPALIDAVNRVGVNVNQLALATHTGRDFVRYWQEIGREVEQVLERLIDQQAGET